MEGKSTEKRLLELGAIYTYVYTHAADASRLCPGSRRFLFNTLIANFSPTAHAPVSTPFRFYAVSFLRRFVSTPFRFYAVSPTPQ